MESENTLMDNLIVRKLKIYKDQKEVRSVTQIQLINWPDHMAPFSPYLLYPLIDYVDSGKNFGPVVVHCSAGNGRTGCFIAVYNIVQCLKLLKEINQELQQTVKPFFSVFNLMTTHQSRSMVWGYDEFQKNIQSKLSYLLSLNCDLYR